VVEASDRALLSAERGPAAAAGRGDALNISDTSVISWVLARASSAPVGAVIPAGVSRASDSNWLITFCSALVGTAACGCSPAVAAGHAVVMACARRWRSSIIAAAFASMVAAVELGSWAGFSAPLPPGGGGAGQTMTGTLGAAGGALWASNAPLEACCRTVVASFATPGVVGGPGDDVCGEIAAERTVPVLDSCIVGAAPVLVVVTAVEGPASVLTVPAS
jgi:hypothetical protein